MTDHNFTPIKELTVEIIDNMVIHQTVSSLRRAGSVAPNIIKVEESANLPTLYYIKHCKNRKCDDWVIHALQSDISKYLMKATLGQLEPPTVCPTNCPCGPTEEPTEDPSDEPAPRYKSKIQWDGVTGGKLLAQESNGFLILSGNIAWDDTENPAGNYICAQIIPHPTMIDYYPNATVEVDGILDNLSDMLDGAGFSITHMIYEPGQEIPVRIIWDKDYEERFIIAVTQESKLLSE